MSKRLEALRPGTAVFVGERNVGDVRGVYAVGGSMLAEYINVFWNARSAEVLVPTEEVLEIDDRGVALRGPFQSYDELNEFDSQSFPGIKRLDPA
ncbi:MAG: hypothetical protein DLM50_03015 [Candidatus Meridianibacter frigidus]|nr:MAG: hypothetical protein DLM50_03015 [Candidatus Eremiobacteraeota bacterium]